MQGVSLRKKLGICPSHFRMLSWFGEFICLSLGILCSPASQSGKYISILFFLFFFAIFLESTYTMMLTFASNSLWSYILSNAVLFFFFAIFFVISGIFFQAAKGELLSIICITLVMLIFDFLRSITIIHNLFQLKILEKFYRQRKILLFAISLEACAFLSLLIWMTEFYNLLFEAVPILVCILLMAATCYSCYLKMHIILKSSKKLVKFVSAQKEMDLNSHEYEAKPISNQNTGSLGSDQASKNLKIKEFDKNTLNLSLKKKDFENIIFEKNSSENISCNKSVIENIPINKFYGDQSPINKNYNDQSHLFRDSLVLDSNTVQQIERENSAKNMHDTSLGRLWKKKTKNSAFKKETVDDLKLNSFCILPFNQHHESLSKNSLSLPKKNSSFELWEYLTQMFDEGVAIFEIENIVQCNKVFICKMMELIEENQILSVESCVNLELINENWKNIFQGITMKMVDDAPSSDEKIDKDFNLFEEIIKIINCNISEAEEVRGQYQISQNNLFFNISIFKISINKKSYTVLKIYDISNQYLGLAKKATTKIKKLLGQSLSHEVRTPLNYILSCIKLLKNQIPTDIYNELKYGAQLFSIIIHGVLKVALVDDPGCIDFHQSVFFISKVIEKLIKIMKPLFVSRGIQLSFQNFIKDEKPVLQDKNIILSIIYQFLSNSLKFTQSGLVTVFLKKNPNENEFEIHFQDTGVGMNRIEQSNLKKFLGSNEFIQEKISEKSTGANLGLTISKILIQKMYNNFNKTDIIQFESTEDVGSKFVIKIPANYQLPKRKSIKYEDHISDKEKKDYILENIASLEESCQVSVDSDSNNKPYSTIANYLFTTKFFSQSQFSSKSNLCGCPTRVLVIDDEEFNLISFRMVYNMVMKNSKIIHELLVARNGQAGVSLFLDYYKNKKCTHISCSPIKLIFTDYNMPGKDGIEVVSDIREFITPSESQEIGIFGWTAYLGIQYVEQFKFVGATGILSKPLKTQELKEILISYGFLSLGGNQLSMKSSKFEKNNIQKKNG